jgi:hypothetical protein
VSIETLPRPTSTSSGGDVDHWYCCDPNVAFCGLDITETPEGRFSVDMCPLCVLVDDDGGPGCCV